MRRNWLGCLAFLLPVLTGCLSHTRKLQQPVLAGPVLNADVLDLVKRIDDRYNQIQSFTAAMDFSASVGGAEEGQQTDYASFEGFMLFRKPRMLRVIIKVPVLHTTAVDLGSNGTTFTLLIPPKNRAIEGSNSVAERTVSPSGGLAERLETLRPNIFLDTIVIPGISPDQVVSLIHESEETFDHNIKRLIELPEYDLTVLAEAPPASPNVLAKVARPLRVIRFSRVDLLPLEQDIYNPAGELETQARYGPYKDFNGVKFPSTIDISRPIEGYKIRLTVEKLLTFNQPLTDDQFEVTIPSRVKVQKLE
jgi:outer membrane lipoprotein-sorting protein